MASFVGRRQPHRAGPLVPAALASASAGLVHAAAIGSHADDVGLVRLFTVAAVAQFAAALAALIRPHARLRAAGVVGVNAIALGAWIVTRATGIGWIDGLQGAEPPGLADSFAALLATLAVLGGGLVLVGRSVPTGARAVTGTALVVAALAVPAMVSAAGHAHDDRARDAHDHDDAHDPGDGHDDENTRAAASAATPTREDEDGHDDDHQTGGTHETDETDETHQAGETDETHQAGETDETHETDETDETGPDHDETAAWPRSWDPAGPIDFSGVPGVSPEQQARAEQLVADTLDVLPRFADVSTIGELGFHSIGDENTGFEHFINVGYIFDEHLLDPRYPESLVYQVDGDERTLVSAMFITSDRPVNDPELVDVAGPLMEWHVHDNLCWGDDDGTPVVEAVTDDHGGVCPPGTVLAGGENPMVHVWIAPHDCGPFAALEGHGAGQAATGDRPRADQCQHDHDDDQASREPAREAGDVPPRPYDPELPIDLGGVEGVTLQQQAFAEQLVAVTLRYLPQWADPAIAEAYGFRSIGDADTGHEHYIQWDWIDDDVWLDPNRPESLVYEPRPDGTKELVSAMYMLPGGTSLDEVPDWGGPLMQWHVHEDLCFTDDEAPSVAAVVEVGGDCPDHLQKMEPAPMIHVWIRPHECGPFAALDGVGAGQVADGEEHRCNHAHGAH